MVILTIAMLNYQRVQTIWTLLVKLRDVWCRVDVRWSGKATCWKRCVSMPGFMRCVPCGQDCNGPWALMKCAESNPDCQLNSTVWSLWRFFPEETAGYRKHIQTHASRQSRHAHFLSVQASKTGCGRKRGNWTRWSLARGTSQWTFFRFLLLLVFPVLRVSLLSLSPFHHRSVVRMRSLTRSVNLPSREA